MAEVYDPRALGLEIASKSRNEVRVRCPFHNDHTPSATFNLVKGLFHCFGCDTNANVQQLAKELGGHVQKVDAKLIIAEDSPTSDREFHTLLSAPLALRSGYLRTRQVRDWQIKKWQILKTKEGIVFPLGTPDGRVTGVQVRRFDGTPKYDFFGIRQPVWPMQNITAPSKHGVIFLTEGVFGVLRAEPAQAIAVAVMGASSTHRAIRMLSGRRVVSTFDPDFAGLLAAAKLITFGIPAAYPSFEPDELDIESWKEFASGASRGLKTTGSIYQLLDQHPKAQEIYEAWDRWRKKLKKDQILKR